MRTGLLLFLLPVLNATAQPVLEHPAAIPTPGGYAVETRSYGAVPGIATTGADVLWDLSAISYSVIGTTVDSILDPANTPYASDYPAATHAVRLVDQFGYYQVTDDHVDDLGYRISAGSPSFIYSDPGRILQFPSAVGDSWSDQTLSGSTASTLTVTVLAEGEIRLADQSIPDAVLVRRVYQGSTTATSTTWFRRSDGLRPLGNLLSNGTVIMRAPVVGTGTGITERTAPPVFGAFPVPTSGSLTIRKLDGSPLDDVRVLDGAGRTVLFYSTRNNASTIDLSDQPAGNYVIGTGRAGQWSVQQVVKLGRTPE